MSTNTLKILREVHDYRQEYIAEDILGISQSTYAKLEQNPSKITAEQAQKLSDFYKVSIANLMSEVTPVITFKDSITHNKNGSGYVQNQTVNNHDAEMEILKAENEYLKKINLDLLQMLGEKLKRGDN